MLLFKQPAIILMTLLLIFVGKAYASDVIINASQTCEAKVINNDYLHTWWHCNSVFDNSSTIVGNNIVRGSTVYSAQVASANDNVAYDSFIYMSIPRGGQQKTYTTPDGAEFANSNNLTMSWTSFEYDKESASIFIQTKGIQIDSIDDITIRPIRLMNLFKLTLDQTRPNSIRIDIPYSNNGYKFSVEFKHDILDVRNNKGSLALNIGNKVLLYLQEWHHPIRFSYWLLH